ncbi:hypothetical protein [Actinomadura litoris]|uniref:Uncharacterized protein n=1 Tax=Actinomadura litoris TaxID=2678616 RepID=A0A7K1LB50_9ACTN|nr:hypothetical protein [Actinomadura litoris]MUN41476.1 hypothetical protein [Actinomadura litoris]
MTNPTTPKASELKPGTIADITIKGARIERGSIEGHDSDTTRVVQVAIVNPDGRSYFTTLPIEWAPVVVEPVGQGEGPPQTDEEMHRQLASAIGGTMILRTSVDEIATAALKVVHSEQEQLRALLAVVAAERDEAHRLGGRHRTDAARAERERDAARAEADRFAEDRAAAYDALTDQGRAAMEVAGCLADGINAVTSALTDAETEVERLREEAAADRQALDRAAADHAQLQVDMGEQRRELKKVEAHRGRLAEQVNGDRLHAVIEAALIAYWCLERGKEPDQLDIAAAGSHAYMLVDALHHAGMPTGRAPAADAHGVREAVTEAVRALDGAEADEPVDSPCIPYLALVGHRVEVLTMADESVTGLLVRCDRDARELRLVTSAGEQGIPWDLVAAARPAVEGAEVSRG